MSFEFREGHRVFVYNAPIDFRAGFDRLSMFVREKMQMKLVEGDLFLFLGRNRKRLKALVFDGTGLLLLSKRLERGRFMSVNEIESFELTISELNLIMSGGVIRRKIFGEDALTISSRAFINDLHGAGERRDQHRSAQTVHGLVRGPG